MSLEERIAELTAAVKENTEQLREAAAGRAEVLAAAKEVSTKAKPAAKATETPKSETPTETPAAPKPDAAASAGQSEPNECQKAVIEYLGETEGEERKARNAKVKEILGKVGAARAGDVPADKVKVFLNTFKKLQEMGNLVQVEDESAGDEDESLV